MLEADRQFNLSVRLLPDYRRDVEAIKNVKVGYSTGVNGQNAYIPLSELADVTLDTGASYIYRERSAHYLPIKFSVRGRRHDGGGPENKGTEQIADRNGVNFRLSDPALLFGEAQYSYNQDKASYGLAGTIKLGGWYHAGSFNDNHFGYDGKSLADPSGVGVPLSHGGDFAVCGVVDQMLWRPGDDPKKGAAFLRG